jgi:hypothetical protein
MKQLRRHQTNSGDDSKGHSMGLAGDQFLYVIAAIILGVVLLIGGMKSGLSPGTSLILAVIPIPFVILFLVVFKINKPPRYQGDLIQKWFGNTSITRGPKKKNPYLLAKKGQEQLKSKTFVFFK